MTCNICNKTKVYNGMYVCSICLNEISDIYEGT